MDHERWLWKGQTGQSYILTMTRDLFKRFWNKLFSIFKNCIAIIWVFPKVKIVNSSAKMEPKFYLKMENKLKLQFRFFIHCIWVLYAIELHFSWAVYINYKWIIPSFSLQIYFFQRVQGKIGLRCVALNYFLP